MKFLFDYSTNNNWEVVKNHISKTPSGDKDLLTITKQGIETESTIYAVVPGTVLNTLLRGSN